MANSLPKNSQPASTRYIQRRGWKPFAGSCSKKYRRTPNYRHVRLGSRLRRMWTDGEWSGPKNWCYGFAQFVEPTCTTSTARPYKMPPAGGDWGTGGVLNGGIPPLYKNISPPSPPQMFLS